jgi:hypothetical protein
MNFSTTTTTTTNVYVVTSHDRQGEGGDEGLFWSRWRRDL